MEEVYTAASLRGNLIIEIQNISGRFDDVNIKGGLGEFRVWVEQQQRQRWRWRDLINQGFNFKVKLMEKNMLEGYNVLAMIVFYSSIDKGPPPKKKSCLVVLHCPPLTFEIWKKVFTVQKYTPLIFRIQFFFSLRILIFKKYFWSCCCQLVYILILVSKL